MIFRLPRLKIGVPKIDDLIDEWVSAIERSLNITTTPPLTQKWTGDGWVIGMRRTDKCWVKLTATNGSGVYSGTEVRAAAGGTFAAFAVGGRVFDYTGAAGPPIYEFNLTNLTSLPAYVQIERDEVAGLWRFQMGVCS